MARQAKFTVTLSKSVTEEVTVDYATVDGTATAASGDYTAKSGTLVFAPGQVSKDIIVQIRDADDAQATEAFSVVLSNPQGAVLGTVSSGTATLLNDGLAFLNYKERFNWIYDNLHNTDNGYFGPPTGPKAFTVPYHSPEKLLCEAPDWGHQTASETASFYVGMETWKGILDQSWTGYNACWNMIDSTYVPSPTNQPVGTYNPSSPGDYTPEGDLPSAYPTLASSSAAKGVDGLYSELQTTYGTKNVYLMHWIIDVDGVYGYKNGDGSTLNVFMNSYQRGLQESAWETIPHPEWEDFTQGGGAHGFLPLFSKGKPEYPEAEFDYGKQWRYTCAPDAEARAIQWAFWAQKYATAQGSGAAIAASTSKAKKMGDYLRYALMDKYFRKIGPDRAQGSTTSSPYDACHFLISWYVAWGGEIPASGQEAVWGFRIGSSESHQGYQAPDIAYYMATGGGGFTPQSPSAGDIWLGSLYRQLEMLRWLQTSDGLIAGGVTNSWKGRYETPNDGRQTHTFYGMYYTYAPVWHDPPSNNWFGFQCWGLQRVADLYLEVSDKTGSLQSDTRTKCGVILDRFVNWVLANVSVDPETKDFEIPNNLIWTSDTQVVGETTTSPNLEGKYEYIPMNSWDGTGDHAAFWNASSVPNPTLKFTIESSGQDLGVASCLAGLLIHYAEAKRRMGSFTSVIPNSPNGKTAEDAYQLARDLLDGLWALYRTEKGIAKPEVRTDYSRYETPVYVPPTFNGTMPNGDPINSSSTFISIRSFMKDDPEYAKVQAYLDGGPAPEFTYHRFWAQAEYAMANAAMHHYFNDIIE